ncbi:MAG: cupin domain-containing protein, partial [Mesorhizobium sp.]
MTSSAQIIATLALKPHPEGGWYAETFRDEAGGARGHSTAIYFLLERHQLSAWHR